MPKKKLRKMRYSIPQNKFVKCPEFPNMYQVTDCIRLTSSFARLSHCLSVVGCQIIR